MAKKKMSQNDTIFKSNTNYNTVSKVVDDYIDLFSFRRMPISEAFISHLALELVEWAKNEKDALVFNEFYALKGIHSKTMDRWCEKYDDLRHAKNYAMMVIGTRREKGALTKKLDGAVVMKSHALYDEDWKKLEEWRSKLTKDENADTGTKIVVIEKIADSEKVPTRKGKNVEETSEVDTKG